MKTFVYRNYTLEYLFDHSYAFSGYGDVLLPTEPCDNIVVFYQVDPSKTPEKQIEEIGEITSRINLITSLIVDKRIIVLTLANEYRRNWQLKHAELTRAIQEFNQVFLGELQEKNNVKVIDINTFISQQKIEEIDWRFFFTSQMIINPKLAKPFKKWFAEQCDFISLKRKKCLVLDCDNTLWGGVLGEEGVLGVQLGQDYPGVVFSRFQELLLMLSKKGVILAVCSKNNLTDIQELWQGNPYNLINDKVLSAYRINWQNKAENIQSIAEELNIGVDSIVFVDDNPMERALVRELLPEVVVPDFPEKPYDLIDFFWQVYNTYFITYELSEEDVRKTEQYKENFFRNESKKVFQNIDDYLASLDIEIEIYKVEDLHLTRLAQMTQKTNQFNLRTARYTEEMLRKKQKEGSQLYVANVRDKFGDNGITIACIVDEDETQLFLDSYLLSCRILGREIEKVVLLSIVRQLVAQKKKPLRAEYIPTKKNGMARDFLEQVGFVLESEDREGVKRYVYKEQNFVEIKDYYTVIFK